MINIDFDKGSPTAEGQIPYKIAVRSKNLFQPQYQVLYE